MSFNVYASPVRIAMPCMLDGTPHGVARRGSQFLSTVAPHDHIDRCHDQNSSLPSAWQLATDARGHFLVQWIVFDSARSLDYVFLFNFRPSCCLAFIPSVRQAGMMSTALDSCSGAEKVFGPAASSSCFHCSDFTLLFKKSLLTTVTLSTASTSCIASLR